MAYSPTTLFGIGLLSPNTVHWLQQEWVGGNEEPYSIYGNPKGKMIAFYRRPESKMTRFH